MGRRKKSWEQYLREFYRVHGNSFIYPEEVLLTAGNKTNVSIICPKHGPFSQNINNHLNQKGCPTCGRESKSRFAKLTLGKFYDLAVEKYGLQYVYKGLDHSITLSTEVEIFHVVCGNTFVRQVGKHLRNYNGGCEVCLKEGKPLKCNVPGLTFEDIKG